VGTIMKRHKATLESGPGGQVIDTKESLGRVSGGEVGEPITVLKRNVHTRGALESRGTHGVIPS